MNRQWLNPNLARPLHMIFLAALLAATLLLSTAVPVAHAAAPVGSTCYVPSGGTYNYATIQAAVSDAGCATINIAAGIYNENITISRAVTLYGAGAASTIIDGGKNSRVVDIPITSATVTISGVTIKNGGPTLGYSPGIGIRNLGTLTLTDSIVSDNFLPLMMGGGGIANGGTMTISGSRISHNSAYTGGGIVNYGTMTIINSTLDNNSSAVLNAGGILNSGALTLVRSAVYGNTGGIGNTNVLSVIDSTISGNPFGSDIVSQGGTIYISSSTIAGSLNVLSAQVTLRNSILASCSDNPISRGVMSQGYNLIGTNQYCMLVASDQVGVNPKLGPLQNNGGSTPTHALLPGSPAIDAGNPTGCTDHLGNLLSTDQRGMPRSGRCDIGAFEFQQPDTTPPTITITSPQAKEYLHTATFQVLWTAVDTESGVASESATLDGNAVTKGQTVDLFYLALGPHKITVTAKDKAGNTGSASVTFTVVANIDSLIAAKDRACALGWIDSADVCSGLGDKLLAAKGAIGREQNSTAKNQLNAFLNQLEAQNGKAVNPQAYNLLKADAQYLIDHLP